MRLSRRNHQFEIVELVFDFNQLGEEDSSHLATPDNAYFEIWEVLIIG